MFSLSHTGHQTYFLIVLSMLLSGTGQAKAFKRRKKMPIMNSGNLRFARIYHQIALLSVSHILKFSLLRIGYQKQGLLG